MKTGKSHPIIPSLAMVLIIATVAFGFLASCLPSSSPAIRSADQEAAARPETTRSEVTDMGSATTGPERRVALVVGNSAYHGMNLLNPVNDANDMAAALEQCGFTVIKRLNASRSDMRSATYDFVHQIKKGGVGLFFYAGHGLQVDGINYLVPVDADIKARFDIEDQCLKANYVLRAMEEAENRLNIVILDACRNNPFRRFRDVGRGLAHMNAPRGSLLAFSTSPDDVASDGTGRNGLYTSMLLKHLLTPGQDLIDMFIQVRREVSSASNGKQIPWENQSLMGHFYFVPGATAKVEPSKATIITSPPTPALPPKVGEVQDFSDVIEKRKEAEQQWAGWQSRMETEFRKVENFDQSPRLKPEEKVSAWTSFLSAFGDDNPFSVQDEFMRAKAQERAIYWRNQKETSQVAMAHRPSGGDRTYTNSLGMNFVLIPAGSFLMGSKLSADEVDRKFPGGKVEWYQDEHTRHAVKISRPFYFQSTEVTVGQWREFVLATGYRTEAEKEGWSYAWKDSTWGKEDGVYWDNPGFSQSDSHPVTCVSWNDAQAFVKWLNSKEGTNTYRLPTEAEWEYACRAGTSTVFFWGDDPDKACRYANVADQPTREGRHRDNKFECEDGYWFPAPTASFQPNPWGLYDMIGNVWEWCQDWYAVYPSGSVTDPKGPSSGSGRVGRGGGSNGDARFCRSAGRDGSDPGVRGFSLGFRLVRTQ